MDIFRTAVSRPVATAMVFIAVAVFGLFSYTRLPVDLFPDIESPIMTVITTYTGAGALEVEQNVTDHLESVLGTVPNLSEMTSNSLDNVSLITLEFDWSANMDEATNDVRDRLGRASELLPDEIDDPLIFRFDASAIPVIIYSATAEQSYPELEQIIDDRFVGPLNRIAGVGDVSITGAPEQQVHVMLDPQRLEAYNLDVQTVSQALAGENISSPAGDIDLGAQSFNLRVNAEFQSLEDIRDVIVANVDGAIVRLGQVATVRAGFEDETAISRVNGRRGLTFAVQKQTDANTVEVAEAVRARMPALIEGLPSDVEIETVLDTSDFIVSSVANLTSVLFYALVFVVLVVLVFVRQWRATVIVAATIPISLIVAFIYLALTGSTLNIISLSSLSIALGMVVDDAIVVIENVMRHIESGTRPREAAIYGTREVGVAVIATTLTVVAVFLPLTFLTGMTGVWFSQLGFIVVVTVVTSTVAALSLTPMMASVMLRRAGERREPRAATRWMKTRIERGLERIEGGYGRLLRWALARRWTVVGASAALFVASLLLIPAVGAEFMPSSDDGQISISGELETSRSLEYTAAVVEDIEARIVREVPELELINSTAGSGGGFFFGGGGGSNEFVVRLQLVDRGERDRTVFEVADALRSELAQVPEVVNFTVTAGSGGGGPDAGQPIEIQIVGHDLEATTAYAIELMEHMESVEGTRDVSMSRGRDRPEFEIVFDRERLSAAGLSASAVATAVRANVAGLTATRYRSGGDEYDVVLRYEGASRSSLEHIARMTVATPTGQRVRVQDLGELREFAAPPNVERIDRERQVTVSAGLYGRPLNEVMGDVRAWVEARPLPPQTEVVFAGDFQEQQESFRDLFLVLLLSIVLVYLVMAAQFESLREPFVIMFSIPFALTGVVLALLLTGTPLSVIGLVGAIILVGIVVKNAIVLIDYVKLLRGRGIARVEAIVAGGISRLRPVLMTTLTTVLAMVPLALNIGEGAEIWRPMALSVIGGLSVSTLVTMVIVPVLYDMMGEKGDMREVRV